MFRLTLELYQNYLRAKDSFVLSELVSLCQTLVNMLNRDEDDILYQAPIVNLEVVGYESYQVYGLMWRFDYLGALISELTWREEGCKDNNKDIPWENLMQLGDQIKALWNVRRQDWQDSDESNKKSLIKQAETEFIQFLKVLLVSDLQELKLRLNRVLMKEYFRFLNNPTTRLFFSLTRPESLVYGSRTEEVLEDDRDPEWYEVSQFIKDCFFPDQNGRAAVVFKREDAKAVVGLPKTRAFSEPRLDRNCIQSMLGVLTDLEKVDSKTQQGKEAILMACQALGEYSHWLSDSFKHNLSVLAAQFPFKALRETRNAIKLAVSHQHRFQLLNTTLQSSSTNDLQYQKIHGELLSLKPLLGQMFAEMTPYISDNFMHRPQSNWVVVNDQMFQVYPVQVKGLDTRSQEILHIFDQLSTGLSGELQGKAQDARTFLEHVLCNHVPFIEIKNERQKVVSRLSALIKEMSTFQFSIGDNAHKKQVHQHKNKILSLLQRKILNASRIPLTHVVPGPSMAESEKFYQALNAAPPGPRLSERDYVESYLNLILASIGAITDLIENLRREGKPFDEIFQLLDENPSLNYSTRFYITVIGQSIRSLEKTNLFVANASECLLAELYSFRWIRNNEMHNMNQPIGESLLRWYNRRVNQEHSRHQASEISAYVVYLERILGQLKANLDEGRQPNSAPFLIACVENDLRRSVEKSGTTYFMGVPDDLWLYRDQMRMIWNFLLPLNTPSLDVVLLAEERPALKPSQPGLYLYKHQELKEKRGPITLVPVQRPENEWTCLAVYSSENGYEFKIQRSEIERVLGCQLNTFNQVDGKIVLPPSLMVQLRLALLSKEHLRSPAAYLLSEGLETSSWVMLHNLYVNRERLDNAAADAKLAITGIDDGPMSHQWDAPLKIGVAFEEEKSSLPIQKERLASFRRATNRILGANVIVEDDVQFQPTFSLAVVANSYFLFKLMQYARPSLEELKNFFRTHHNQVDVNFYVEGYTVLHALKRNYEQTDQDYIKIARHLICDVGADPTLLDKHGDTVLHESAEEGDVEYCCFLLSCDRVDPNQKNRKGKLAIGAAAEHQHTEIVNLLLPHTAVSPKQRLMMAIDLRSVTMAQEAIQTVPVIVSGSDDFEEVPIVKAAEMGHLPILRLLVESGANPKEIFEGNTLLHIHCMSNYPNPGLIQYLVEDCRVLADARDSQNNTALHNASACHYLGLVRELLRLSANSALVNDRGETPLHKVAQCIRMDEDALTIAQLLIRSGTPLRQQDNFAGTILHLAALEDHQELARFVLAENPGLLDIPSQGSFCRGGLPLEEAHFKGHRSFAAFVTQYRQQIIQQYKLQKNCWSVGGGLLVFGATMFFSRNVNSIGARIGLGSAIGLLGGIVARKGYEYRRSTPVAEHDCGSKSDVPTAVPS